MEKIRRYEFEGVVLEIPLRYDTLSQMYIEEYPDFVSNPVYTEQGRPVRFIGEDACDDAETDSGESCPDCASCRYCRPVGSHTWIGVCVHEKHRCGAKAKC